METKFTTTKIWRVTLKKLKLIAAYRGESLALTVDRLASKALEREREQDGEAK